MIEDLIVKNRSTRIFYEEKSISLSTLKWLVNLARLSPSAANMQPLKYIISNSRIKNSEIFDTLRWAGYLNDWSGPVEGERPAAYITIVLDTKIEKEVDCDHGIICQSILLGAVEKGLSGCILGSIDRKRLRNVLSLPSQHKILLVIALGEKKEEIVVEELNSDVKYWRDDLGVHHVPKRSLKNSITRIYEDGDTDN